MLNKLQAAADRAMDLIWDVTEPVAGTCPVCAFYRGALCVVIVHALLALAVR